MKEPRAVLVVDDSAPVRTAVANILRGAGFTVLEAAASDEALAIVASQNLSLVIADLYLDEAASGVALLAQAIELRPGLKGVVMSGAFISSQKHIPFPFLMKPFMPQALIDLAAELTAE